MSFSMLSSEIAELAGVTVRTLRHYHQIGLLAEPPRSSGGYRRYDVGHLVRLLRITRMTALGLPLSALPAVLDDPAAADELLDELDRRAAADIERLVARREDIAALRKSGSPPDLPPSLAVWRTASDTDVPEDMARYEHAQLVLAGHLLGEAGLATVFGDENDSTAAALTARFYALTAESSDDEISLLAGDVVAYIEPVLAHEPPFDETASQLFAELNEQTLRPVQRELLWQVQQRL